MERIAAIHVVETTERKAEPGRFGAALRNAATQVAGTLSSSVALAAPFVPGGTVLAAAVRGALAPAPGALRRHPAAPGTAAPAGEGDLLEATRALQQEARDSNLQYLQLQESMQRESRQFSALTNVMKVKHDSAKSAINNIH